MKQLLFLCALVVVAMAQSELKNIFKTGNDQFSAKMFQEVSKIRNGKSFVLSAFSVLSPLAQLAFASVGESHDEILRAIGFNNDNVTKDIFTDLHKRLKSINGVELKQANKVYVGKQYDLNDKFANESKMIFESEVESIDFGRNEEAANIINAWVENQTNKRITKLAHANEISLDTTAILVNAIHFKGDWVHQFKKTYTVNGPFYVTRGQVIEIPMMNTENNFKYAASTELDAKFLEMPYKGGESSLVIALPNEIDGIDGLIQKLVNPDALNKALNSMQFEEVEVSLPKFKIETTTNLKDVLEKINIKQLFSARDAQLYNLIKNKGDVYMSNAVQKAFIEVNERGTEAAVANEFNISSSSLSEPNRIVFNANHSFAFFLFVDNTLMFSGVH